MLIKTSHGMPGGRAISLRQAAQSLRGCPGYLLWMERVVTDNMPTESPWGWCLFYRESNYFIFLETPGYSAGLEDLDLDKSLAMVPEDGFVLTVEISNGGPAPRTQLIGQPHGERVPLESVRDVMSGWAALYVDTLTDDDETHNDVGWVLFDPSTCDMVTLKDLSWVTGDEMDLKRTLVRPLRRGHRLILEVCK